MLVKRQVKNNKFLILLFTIAASIILAFYIGVSLRQSILYVHFFYIPVILAGMWYYRKAVFIALFLGMLHILLSLLYSPPVSINEFARVCVLVTVACVIGLMSEKRAESEKERKQAVETLLTKERQLAHASRLSTLGEMATAMAHEINQPLTLISMAAEDILQDIKKNRIDMSLLPQDTEDMLHNVRRIDKIITHMRTFARQPGEIKVVEPGQILNDAFIIVGEQLRVHNITVTRHIEEALPPIKVDPNQLEQVFLIILTNARQALGEKGERAERVGESFQKQLKCSILQEGDYVVFEFADNGYGVPDEIKPRIFDPFFTTKETGQGTGLGLSIAYGIVAHSHKGRIWVEDNEMGGATFKVALPVKEQ